MSVRNLATLDRTVFQPLGRILQEAFADGYTGTGKSTMSYTVPISEAGTSYNGIHRFRTTVNITMTSLVVASQMALHFGADGVITLPGYTNTILQLMLSDTGQPDYSGGDISCLDFEYHLDETNGEPRIAVPMHFAANEPGANFDGLFNTQNLGDLGDSAHSGGAGKIVGFDGDADIRKVPVKFASGGVVYYILCGKEMAQVNSD